MSAASNRPLRVVTLMEATTVTGPAKNLFPFIACARRPSPSFPAGVDCSILTFLRGAKSNSFIDAARRAGITVDVVEEQRAFEFSITKELKRVINERNPDVIETHNTKSHFLIRLLGIQKKRPWIAFHHGYVATDAKVHVYNQLDRWSLRGANAIVTVCDAFQRQLEALGLRRDRMSVRHNMIHPYVRPHQEEVDAIRKSLGISANEGAREEAHEKVILSVGRLSREKGHLDLVEALAMLRSSAVAPFRVIIVGEGPDRALIEKRAAELNLSSRLHLVGHQSNLPAWYALADMTVLPSHSEGSPNVLLEALAAGVPTVATEVGGVPEIATDQTSALLVPKRDSKRMAEAMAKLLGDPQLSASLSRAGLEVVRRFTPDAYCGAVLGIYDKVLRSAPA